MGFTKAFQRFFSGDKKNKKNSDDSCSTTATKRCSKNVPEQSPPKTTNVAVDPKVVLSPNQQVMLRFIELCNTHQSLASVFHPRADILFREAPMTLDGFLAEHENAHRCFPDFTLRMDNPQTNVHDAIQELPDGRVVAVLRASGTHTGAPYSFGPYPEIPITNIHVDNDPERSTMTIDDEGKIIRFVIEPVYGELTGPPGFYKQIGGLIF